MRSSCFDMGLIREFDIFFLEIDSVFRLQSGRDIMFIEPSEDFIALSLEGELDRLSIELLLDIECLEESHASLIG